MTSPDYGKIINYLGLFWIWRDEQKRGWHDMIAETFVVVKNQAGIWIGLLCLGLLMMSNVFLGQGVVANWQKNRDGGVYAPFGQMLQEFSQSLKDGFSTSSSAPSGIAY